MLGSATPKLIRELMQVDDLTNDEVKIHLQVLAGLEAQEPKKQLKDRVMQGTRKLFVLDTVSRRPLSLDQGAIKVEALTVLCLLSSVSEVLIRQVKMVDEHCEEVLKASTSKGAESLKNDANNDDDNENRSSSSSGDPNFRGLMEEETKILSSMIKKQVGKVIKNVIPYYISQTTDYIKEIVRKELEELRKGGLMNDFRNEMATYHDFTTCDVPKFDGTLDPIASTRWLFAVEGALCTSSCKEKSKVNFASNFLRDSAKMWWDEKICEQGEEWIGSCTWKEFKELFNAEYTLTEEVDKIREEFQTLMQTNETVNKLWKKFNDLIRYCP
ncbi:zinc finger, CCHC-type, retrotransposon gag domain protein [Tanacetum coccineum]